ncbi:MAG: hypothetical protein ACRELF_22020, partial [Gemmataceae bacterium]
MAGCAGWFGKIFRLLVFVVLVGGGIVAWHEHATLLSRFYVSNLVRASESNRQRWLARVAKLGETAVPELIDY